jgi:hypothetical protein
VRRAARVLKKKDPEQLFSGFCRPVVRCAPKPPRREKNSHAKRKRISYTTAPCETI